MSCPTDAEKTINQPSVEGGSQDDRYTVYTRAERWCIVAIVSYGTWSSNVCGFIYYPALKLLSQKFSVSVSQVNLTITSYMVVATVAPTLIGDAADVLGRRPTFIVLLILYIVSDICLALAKRYDELLGLRVLQAMGVSGIIPIGYGVISDIASPAERGSFVSAVSFTTTIAPTIGPIFGGALSYTAGWAWIFWFLTINASIALVLIVCLLPETSRNIVGNGSIQPPTHLQLPTSSLMCHWKPSECDHARYRGRMPNPLKSFKLLLRKDNLAVVLAFGLMYAVYTCIIGSLSTLFIETYGLNQWQAGIIYIPFGIGGTVSTLFSGRLLDSVYRKARAKLGLSTDRIKGDDLDNFPIERVRLQVMWMPMLATGLFTVAYGWVLNYKLHLAIPLVIQFVIGLALQLNFSAFSTLIVDINHRSPSAANASANLIRCSLGAIAIAFLQDMIDAVRIGWTFTFVGGLCFLALGLFAIEYYYGMSWRQAALRSENSR